MDRRRTGGALVERDSDLLVRVTVHPTRSPPATRPAGRRRPVDRRRARPHWQCTPKPGLRLTGSAYAAPNRAVRDATLRHPSPRCPGRISPPETVPGPAPIRVPPSPERLLSRCAGALSPRRSCPVAGSEPHCSSAPTPAPGGFQAGGPRTPARMSPTRTTDSDSLGGGQPAAALS